MAAPYSHIACCVDGSDASRVALGEARRLRALGPGRLSILHVVVSPYSYVALGEGLTWLPPEEDFRADAQRWLAEWAQAGEATVVLEGHPGTACCDWAAGEGADLLVAASHRGLVERALMGSFAVFVARHAPCPVLLVRP